MKRILTIAFLLIAIIGYSQIPKPSVDWGNSFKRLFITQGDTVTTKLAGGLQVISGVLYIADGTKWAMVTGGGGSTDSLTFATWKRLYKVNDSMKVVYSGLYNFTNGYGLNKSSLTFSTDTTTIQKKLSAGAGIAISGNTIYNTGSTSSGKVYAGNGLANVNDSTLKADTSILKTVLSAQNDSLTLAAAINAKPNFGDVRDEIKDSLENINRIKAGTSAGVIFQTNSAATAFSYGAGGSTEVTFNGFAGYNANRSSSYTSRSFTDKNYVDSLQANITAGLALKLNASDSSNYSLRTPDANVQASSYTLVLSDAGKFVEINNASANTLTIPPNSSVAFPIGTIIYYVQRGAGVTTFTAGSGVTLVSWNSWFRSAGQTAYCGLRKTATNTWDLFGNIMP